MYRDKTVGVVVPAFNEELQIGKVIETMPTYVDKVYIVDDHSTDNTSKIILSYNDDRITLIRHSKNSGVGAAVVTGYKLALHDDMDLIAVMDGDNQMDPDELPKLLDPVVDGRFDYTKGDRLSRLDLKKGMSRWRRFGNFLLTQLTRISSGYWNIQDPQNAYAVISKQTLKKLNLDEVYPRYGYLNDLLFRLNLIGARIHNVQIPARYGNEKSKIKYGQYIRKVSMLLLNNFISRIVNNYIFPRVKVVGISYVIGLILLFTGTFTILISGVMRALFTIGFYSTLVGIFLFIISMIIDAHGQNKKSEKLVQLRLSK